MAGQRVFERSVAGREAAEPWVFYEGPPTANGRPGLHHVWARVYKDLFCRYRTMRGFRVARRAGWDTHGLPVEVEVEKRLGITGKRQIETEVGIAEFTRLCRESVLSYVEDWRRLTERIGYWVDLDAAYWTFDPAYVAVGLVAPQAALRPGAALRGPEGRARTARGAAPRCPATSWASPDVYSDEEDESAYVRLPLVESGRGAPAGRTSLVVWTTTPWTLPSNTGVAVHPDLDLRRGRRDGGRRGSWWTAVFGEGATVGGAGPRAATSWACATAGRSTCVPGAAGGADGWRVVPADYVTTEEGTGLVHLAPAFGEVDRQVGREHGLPDAQPGGAGRAVHRRRRLAGRPGRPRGQPRDQRPAGGGGPAAAPPALPATPTRTAGAAGRPLIYWGKPSWYVATSTRKDDLVAANRTVDWHPAHIRDGRFGEWLENNVDWALSRDRFWGTPLPDLALRGRPRLLRGVPGRAVRAGGPRRAGRRSPPARHRRGRVPLPRVRRGDGRLVRLRRGPRGFEPELVVGQARRVEPVIDAWFDSGSMPAAQVGYPLAGGSEEAFAFPADFITEAIDQTRGWFYSLLAVNTLVFGRAPYRHVMCLGHIVDADGRKMSKSLGNVIDPWEILGTRGADPLRWWMFSQGSPWTPTRVSLRGHRHLDARHAAHAVEHAELLHHLRLAQRLRPGRPRGAPAIRPPGPGPLGALAAGLARWPR